MLCLTHRTSERWVLAALANLDAVLVDHAHCEMKAASNALSLAVRSSEKPRVVAELVTLAEEELSHFRRMLGELERRGIPLGPPPTDDYAAELRRAVRAHAKQHHPDRATFQDALVDRFLVAALIEARSCERFRILTEALAEKGPADLCALYGELLAAEARHFRTFVDLARMVAHPDEARIDERLAEVAELEGEVSSRLLGAAAIHG